jgi:uncharacterized protein YndB with AHSA1/START domain
MRDIVSHLNAVHRATGDCRIGDKDGRTASLRRSYDAPVEEVWDAITDADRLKRWFVPVSGDLRLGGRYQIEGNAGGEIVRCEPPRLLRLTWIYGEQSETNYSEVEVRLTAGHDGETVFELDHAARVDPAMWGQFGPGAVGVGWDLTLLGLGLHLSGGAIEEAEREAWQQSAEARDFMTRSSNAWGEAHLASGASRDEVESCVANTTKAYVPEQ